MIARFFDLAISSSLRSKGISNRGRRRGWRGERSLEKEEERERKRREKVILYICNRSRRTKAATYSDGVGVACIHRVFIVLSRRVRGRYHRLSANTTVTTIRVTFIGVLARVYVCAPFLPPLSVPTRILSRTFSPFPRLLRGATRTRERKEPFRLFPSPDRAN